MRNKIYSLTILVLILSTVVVNNNHLTYSFKTMFNSFALVLLITLAIQYLYKRTKGAKRV